MKKLFVILYIVKVKSLSRVQLLVTPWTAAYQAPLSMGFSKQEYWSGVPLPSRLFCFKYHLFIYFAALGLSCGTQNLRCSVWDLVS